MIAREIADILPGLHKYFPIISITGPRQSGKTTIIKSVFKNLPYYNMEDADQRYLVTNDARLFLNKNKAGAIIDEAQRAPEIFSYLQTHVDENKKSRFVLSGSQNFLLAQNITQSLAGRVGLVTLLPLSKDELKKAKRQPTDVETLMFNGFYPGLYDRNIPHHLFFSSYMQTYVERDVRLIKNIENVDIFQRFIRLCAARTGQIVNMSLLASDTGVSVNTVKAWISLLESSYLIFLLRPYFININKRLVKSPKLYFTDTGLLCHLLGIENPAQLDTHYARGNIFENFVLAEILKMYANRTVRPLLWFWQDSNKKEVDVLIEKNGKLIPIEIKSAQTFSAEFVKNTLLLKKEKKLKADKGYVIYAGEKKVETTEATVLNWNNFTTELKDKLF